MMISLALLLLFPSNLFAAEAAESAISAGDTAWMLIATAIVIFMHVPGLALFYGGLVSDRNVVSTMMHSFVSLLVVSIVWVLWGYTLSFGTDIGGLIGSFEFFGFNNVGDEAMGTIPHYIFAMFQCAFAAITVAIISGGIAGRISFPAWILFSALWVTFIYSPMAHWVWGGGWLYEMGELDFAGGTVVHILSGVSALTAAIVIGPRSNHLEKGHHPHNIVLFLIGAATLWFGWFGFNSGSALASGGLTALSFANTQVAASAGGLGWLFIEWIHRKRPTLVGAATGAIAGLVGVTPAAGFVTVPSAIIIGLIAAPVGYFGIHFVKARFKYDDTLDAFGVHGLAGIWGAIATGLFATTSVNEAGNNGLFYGNPEQLLHQLIGVGTAILLATVGTFVILKVISLFMPLRVSKEDELRGLDLSFHEERAYSTVATASTDSKSTSIPS
ncbi:ammonium transporter [Gracilibacillus oryzae]|uniref:Ammonium transporter n=2 Tax=Gracilibacillus oryzae TaxID=1672701 RepID=A0A7C8L3Z0_9BACI|nr:ammonium transporter [Gracilibacillus oryzae]